MKNNVNRPVTNRPVPKVEQPVTKVEPMNVTVNKDNNNQPVIPQVQTQGLVNPGWMFKAPDGVPLNYDQLVMRKAHVERQLEFAIGQRDHYEKALKDYIEKADRLETEYPGLVEEADKIKATFDKFVAKLDPRVKVEYRISVSHADVMKGWTYEVSLREYRKEIESIKAKMPEYRINVKLAEKALEELNEYFK